MDLASLIGLIGAVGMILAAMIAAGVAPFIDTQSILIVFEEHFWSYVQTHCLGSFGAMAKAFMPKART